MRKIVEEVVSAERCSIVNLAQRLRPILSAEQGRGVQLAAVESVLGTKLFKHVFESLIRASFLIEADVGGAGTKYDCRWGSRLAAGDPRRSDPIVCEAIFWKLFAELAQSITDGTHLQLLRNVADAKSLPYELPIDYVQRLSTNMHVPENIRWLWDSDHIREALKLRRAVRDASLIGVEGGNIAAILDGKVAVKTYLTDRALTGDYKTNREKRWEAHPQSHQFAFRADCIMIEDALTRQILMMHDFPASIRSAVGLEADSHQSTRCPITFDLLSYRQLVTEVRDPSHGKSRFQVGHLNPLKGGNAGAANGHTPANIGWVSEDGNRIQGYLSLLEVRALLGRIAHNYAAAGTPLSFIPPTPES